jgi:hypothetical protein
MGEKKVVWVLGSGFSCGLGGPMLNQLMDKSRYRRLDSLYLGFDGDGNAPWAEAHGKWAEIVEAYNNVANDKDIGQPWRDPEEFIEYLHLAAHEGEHGRNEDEQAQANFGAIHYTKDWRSRHKVLAELGTQYLAAVTYEFIAYSKKAQTERWEPYKRWIEQVGENDEIVTFNWDLVVETAHRAVNGSSINRTGVDQTKATLHKLHGSIDWVHRHGSSILAMEFAEDAILRLKGARQHALAIGVPGPGKQLTCQGLFSPMWDAAEGALRSANEIVFIGYRFPPSDSFAKRRLLTAIGENPIQDLKVRLVLGPERAADVTRLEGLLRWALSLKRRGEGDGGNNPLRYSLVHEPMWAEDFMAVYNRNALR